ncbi:MAG: UvrD-helicase domain-containing protein, partial [Clostridiales bacterium]|nr:UvrD-helicase domain-containing protein [Clostridiales bacterium]
MRKWTPEQLEAIYSRNPSTLVSAAAGSGKTAVLIERIYSLLTDDHMDLSRLVVVTFTRAAASEMRERLANKLQGEAGENLFLRQQLEKLDQATITTLHGFCGKIVKEFFHLADMDPTARLFEGGQREELLQRAMDEALDQAYTNNQSAFFALAQRYTDQEIIAMVRSLYSFLMSQGAPWQWLDNQLSSFPTIHTINSHPWFLSYCATLYLQAEGLLFLTEEMEHLCQAPETIPIVADICQQDRLASEVLCEALQNPTDSLWDFSSTLSLADLRKVPRKKSPEQEQWYQSYKEKRDQWKKLMDAVRKALPEKKEQTLSDIQSTLPALQGLCQLTRAFYEEFSLLKKEYNVYDYHDLEHKTLKVLHHPQAKEELWQRIDAIFVDEYQDTSAIQESILQALHHKNQLFMVGDVKQSIYRFRLADPTLFLEKFRHFSKEADATERRIDLQKNFRSDPGILTGVNQVFRHVMDEKVTEIAYDAHAMLIPGQEKEKEEGELSLLINFLPKEKNKPSYQEEEEETPAFIDSEAEEEARFIAQAFLELHGQTVDSGEQAHTLSWKDMVILLPTAKNIAKKVSLILQSQGIPVYSDADEEYFSLPEVDLLMAFLKVIDNPFQDLPLLQVLKASPFLFSETELANIRLATPAAPSKKGPTFFHHAFMALCEEESSLGIRCKKAFANIKHWQKTAELLPLDAFVWQLLEDTSIYIQYGAMAGGHVRQANLRMLCQRAYDY